MKIPHLKLHALSGLWFPEDTDADAGFEYMIKRVTDIDVAMKLVHKNAVCVQAGGNIGMWPRRLAKFFELVHTFEPVPHIFGALSHNIRGLNNIVAHNQLLGSRVGETVPFSVRKGGVSRVVGFTESNSTYTSTTIDALNLPCCDALFLDVEGHELEALKGAQETIKKFRPVITVEVWDANEVLYLKYFESIRYIRQAHVHGDWVFVPR